jgi:hypothetical protein
MTLKLITGLLFFVIPFRLFCDQSFYCPQNHGYINIGMTADQVLSACGEPQSMQESNQPVLKKVQVQQLIFNNQGTATAFYGPWTIPTQWTGAQLEVDIIDNKVKAIKVNGTDNNAFSICDGVNIQIDDPVGKVYGACGGPSVVNNTFINVVVPSNDKPKIWIYQPSPYQPTITLTFIDGKLQSIN